MLKPHGLVVLGAEAVTIGRDGDLVEGPGSGGLANGCSLGRVAARSATGSRKGRAARTRLV